MPEQDQRTTAAPQIPRPRSPLAPQIPSASPPVPVGAAGHTGYVWSRLIALGVSPDAVNYDHLASLIGRGYVVAFGQQAEVPHVELAYRGAIEVLIERLAHALMQGEPARSPVNLVDPNAANPVARVQPFEPVDLITTICPLWPFC